MVSLPASPWSRSARRPANPPPPRMVSSPLPPRIRSRPNSPFRMSLPAPPNTRSKPRPALTVSLPAPAFTRSAPPSAFTTSSPPLATMRSLPGVPVKWLLPLSPMIVAAIATAASTKDSVPASDREMRILLLRCLKGHPPCWVGAPLTVLAPRSCAVALGPGGLLRVSADLGQDPLQARLGIRVHVSHRRRHGWMHAGDLGVQGVRHRAVGGVALTPRAELHQVHGLAGVHVEDVADAVPEGERVGGDLGPPRLHQACVLGPRALEAGAIGVGTPARLELLGYPGAEVGREPLPLDGEHAVALEVAEGAVVRHHLEPVAESLEPTPRPVAAIAALAHQVGQQRCPLVRRQGAHRLERLLLGARRRLEHQRGQQVVLRPLGAEQGHARPSVGVVGPPEPKPRGPAGGGLVALLEVLDPLAAAVG